MRFRLFCANYSRILSINICEKWIQFDVITKSWRTAEVNSAEQRTLMSWMNSIQMKSVTQHHLIILNPFQLVGFIDVFVFDFCNKLIFHFSSNRDPSILTMLKCMEIPECVRNFHFILQICHNLHLVAAYRSVQFEISPVECSIVPILDTEHNFCKNRIQLWFMHFLAGHLPDV